MFSEYLKKLLSEDLTKQLSEALKGKGKDGKDIELVIGNDGSYVPADKYDLEKSKAEKAEAALKAAAEAAKLIGGSGDPAKLADDVKTAKQTIDDLPKNHAKEIAKLQKNTALRIALADKAHDANDIIGLLDVESVEVDDKGNLKSNIDELIKPHREAKPYLFKEVSATKDPDLKGAKPAPAGDAGKGKNELAWNAQSDTGIALNPLFK